MAQEVNCKLLTAVVGIRYRVYLCGICDEVATREAFLLSLGSSQSVRLHSYSILLFHSYRGADKSLSRPWKERSYSDQDLQHYTKAYGVQTTAIYSYKSWYSVVSLGLCSLFPSKVGLRTYQHPCILPTQYHLSN